MISKVLNYMIFESLDSPGNDIEIGFDYECPDKTLEQLKQWIDIRAEEYWQ